MPANGIDSHTCRLRFASTEKEVRDTYEVNCVTFGSASTKITSLVEAHLETSLENWHVNRQQKRHQASKEAVNRWHTCRRPQLGEAKDQVEYWSHPAGRWQSRPDSGEEDVHHQDDGADVD